MTDYEVSMMLIDTLLPTQNQCLTLVYSVIITNTVMNIKGKKNLE